MKVTTLSGDEILSEYDFDYSKAKNNRFAKEYHVSVTLDSDVANVFKTSESVNKVLRAILTAIPTQTDNPKNPALQDAPVDPNPQNL